MSTRLNLVSPWRDDQLITAIQQQIRAYRQQTRSAQKNANRPLKIMEVCGGQTHAIIKHGLDKLLKDEIEFLHGPGCPVCVTPIESIDDAQALAQQNNVILCTFGDMLQVPGSQQTLAEIKARGADIRIIYSPLDTLAIARHHPDREVVLFAIGFETTAPANAYTLAMAKQTQLKNFSVLTSQMLTPPVIAALLETADHSIDGFLAPGHVCTITGLKDYQHLAEHYDVPMVITGFEPVDILQGTLMLSQLLADKKQGYSSRVTVEYTRSVQMDGNPASLESIYQVFEVSNQIWRGIGQIPKSGLKLKYEYAEFDAVKKLLRAENARHTSIKTPCGRVLKGELKPDHCPAFGKTCTPLTPLGAPMVSSEGACSAYFQYA